MSADERSLPESVMSALGRIEAEKRDAEGHLALPVTTQALAQTIRYAATELGASIDPVYVRFLERMNGLDFNGFMLYGAYFGVSKSIFDWEQMNRLFSEKEERRYVLYGETGDELFAQDLIEGTWVILDRPSLSPLDTFRDSDEWLSDILWQMLR